MACWLALESVDNECLVIQCQRQREEKNLCDWAYVMLTRAVAQQLAGVQSNEAVMLQLYLLHRSGFRVRLAKAGDRLCLLMGSRDEIYSYRFLDMDGIKYYILDTEFQELPLLVFRKDFPNGRLLTLTVSQPRLAEAVAEERVFALKHHPELKATVRTDLNLMAYYASLPRSGHWSYYREASLSDAARASLYPALRKAMEGKNEVEQANLLLDFVQSLAYCDDRKQFGHERPLYPDETLYYPCCDCDDRAILFACLVGELMDLETVFLKWPSHVAVGVCFNSQMEGDAVESGGKRFAICDPTFIGAEVGRCATKVKGFEPIVIDE